MIPLDQACSSESIRLLDRLWENSDPTSVKSNGWSFTHHLRVDVHYYRYQFTKSLCAAVKRGDLAIVKWILNHFSGCIASVEVVEVAAFHGRLEILQYLLEQDHERNVLCWGRCDVGNAIEAKFPIVARWLHENTIGIDRDFSRAMKFAVRQADMTTIHWLLEVVSTSELLLPPPAMNDAASGGHLEVLNWIFEQGYDSPSECALEEAAKNGRLDMVQWLVEHNITEGASQAVEQACSEGHLVIVQWLFERRLGRDALSSMTNAIQKGDLDIVKYLDELHIVDVPSDMMNEAASNGHLHVVQWLCEKYRDELHSLFPTYYSSEDDDGYSRQTAMDRASANGHLDVLEFLHLLGESMKTEGKRGYPACSDRAFSTAAAFGHLTVVKWLYHTYPDQCRSQYTTNMATRSNRLEVLQWLHKHTDVIWSTAAMDEAAENGHLFVVKWLHKKRSEGCTWRAMDYAAQKGHLHVVRWLHSNRTEGCTDGAMNRAARQGHFEVLLFLHTQRTEGSTLIAKLGARSGDHHHILAWLAEHYPDPMWTLLR